MLFNQWEKSDHPEFWDKNMNSLYNAFTEVYKGNLVALPQRSDALHSVLDAEVGFDLSAFDEVKKKLSKSKRLRLNLLDEEWGWLSEQIDGEVPASLYEDYED